MEKGATIMKLTTMTTGVPESLLGEVREAVSDAVRCVRSRGEATREGCPSVEGGGRS
jgi:hypothetical protein